MTRQAAPARFNPFSAEFRRDPYPLYRELREARPVHKTLGLWVLTRHADVRDVLRDRRFSAGLIPRQVSEQASRLTADTRHEPRARPGDFARIERLGLKSLVFTDNPDHARLRGLVNRVFTARAVAGLRTRVRAVAGRLARQAQADGGMDAIAGFAAPLPVTVMCDWMALPGGLGEQVGRWTHDIRFLLEPGLMSGGDLTRVAAAVEAFAGALAEVVARRRPAPGDDLVSQLIAARTAGGDQLSDEEIVFVCIMCFVAGNETTKSLIGNGLLALLSHPRQGDRLRQEPALAQGAVDEALRYDSPLQMTKRLALSDVEIGGQRIREGDQVLLCLGAANRDPAAFPSPDKFDITRGGTGHLAFGHGMHGCLGGMLAQLQAEAAFRCLYRPGLQLELLTTELDWQDHSFIVRGLRHLPVSLRATP